MVFLNKTEILSLLHWQFFLVCRKTRSVSVSNQFILSSVGVDGIFCRIRKNLLLGHSLNLKLNTRLRTIKIRKLDVDAFREEGKRFKSQIHLIIISRDS